MIRSSTIVFILFKIFLNTPVLRTFENISKSGDNGSMIKCGWKNHFKPSRGSLSKFHSFTLRNISYLNIIESELLQSEYKFAK